MYQVFNVELQFRYRIYGGLPKDKNVYENYAKSKFKSEDIEKHATDLDLEHATDLDLEEEMKKSTVVFRRDEIGLYIGSYQIKAMIGQSASLLEITVKKRGSKQTLREGMVLKGRDQDGKYTEDKVYFLPLRKEADGLETHAGNVSTAQGNRSILKRMEYVENANISFSMMFLANRVGDDNRSKKMLVEDIKNCLQHGQEIGLGSHRKFEVGKFDVIIFEEISEEDSGYKFGFLK